MRASGALSLGVCVLFVLVGFAGMDVESGKPAPPAPPPEKYGTLDLHQDAEDQLVTTVNLGTGLEPWGYVRLYDWSIANGNYTHVWSADAFGGCLIGDIDNDLNDELAAFCKTSSSTGKGKNQVTVTKIYLQIWEDNDDSASPSYSQLIDGWTYPAERLGLGDVDCDTTNELVLFTGSLQVWDFTADANGKISSSTTGPTKSIKDNGHYIGEGGLEVGDSDDDGYDEMLIGMAAGRDYSPDKVNDCRIAVVDCDKATGTYAVVDYIGHRVLDDATVADLDNDGHNEIFMSGANVSIFIWRYGDANSTYYQIFDLVYDKTVEEGFTYLQSNGAADIDGCGYPEILGGHNYNHTKGTPTLWYYKAHVFKYDKVNKAWTDHTNVIDSGITQLDTMAEGDPDGCGLGEVVYDRTVMEGATDGSGHTIVKVIQHISEAGAPMALDMG